MKHVKVILLLAMTFCLSQFALANPLEDPIKGEMTLSQQIKTILVDSEVAETINEDVQLEVTFMVTSESEILVLSTNDKSYDEKMKSILNYQKISSTRDMINHTFIVPITLQKGLN